MLPIKTILHPTDFSEQAGYAFAVACTLARDYGARLVVCHVYQPLPVAYGEFGAVPPDPGETVEALRKRVAEIRPADGAIPVDRYVVEGHAPTEIVRLAREAGADVIVMGTHGRTGLGRLLLGSVAELVMRKAPCPVLTLRMPFPADEPEAEAVIPEAEQPAEAAAR